MAGQQEHVLTWDHPSSGNVVNQSTTQFTGLGQLSREYQAHDGSVVTGGGSPTPYVGYTNSEMASGVNHSRPTMLYYPNGRQISYDYGTGGGLNDTVSRLSAMKDGGTTLESYDYLGMGTVVRRAHAQSGVDLTYIKQGAEGTGDAGDQYTGLDRFGRIYDQHWITAANGVAVDRYQYGHDRNGNRTYKDNLVNTALGEIYSYDSLNQLTGFDRGTLNGSKNGLTGAASRAQDWDYDALGNMDAVTTDGGSPVTRSHNRQNEITGISGATTPTFDANGNMTTDETGKQYIYDAWNRAVTVKNSGGTTIASYEYDGKGRRIQETAGGVTTDLYYSAGWQVLEERVSGNATKSYVWSPVYVDAMVARDRDTDANGSLDERLYVTHDANFNVTGLVTTGGTVVERYTYDPYGVAQVRDGAWTVTTTAYVWQYLHQGGRLSGESGLYAFRNREYSPTLGRWVTVDPIYYHSKDANLYRAYFNNSLLYIDPTGFLSIFFHGYGGPGGSSGADGSAESSGSSGNSSAGSGNSSSGSGSSGSQPSGSSAPGGSSEGSGAGGSSSTQPNGAPQQASYPLYRNWTTRHFEYYQVNEAYNFIVNKVGKAETCKEPIVLIGHSWGGDAAIKLASKLNDNGYKVELLATLDPVTEVGWALAGSNATVARPKNVKTAWNWYQDQDRPMGSSMPEANENNFNAEGTVNPSGQPIKKILGHRDVDDAINIRDKIKKEVERIERQKR